MAKLQAESKELAELKAELAKLPSATAATNEAVNLFRLRRQIEARMETTKDARELSNLTAAHDRLFKAWCVLTDTKSPGTSKGSRRQRAAEVQPIGFAESGPGPGPAAPSTVYWDYDGL